MTKLTKIEITLEAFQRHIMSLWNAVYSMKKETSREKFVDWMKRRAVLLKKEESYKKIVDAKKYADDNGLPFKKEEHHKKYFSLIKAGTIVHLDLGYNVAHEYGGRHYGIVMKESPYMENLMFIIPLTSKKDPKKSVRSDYLDLGVLPGISTKDGNGDYYSSVAMVTSAVTVSKLRITNLEKKYGSITIEQLKVLQDKFLKEMFPQKYREWNLNRAVTTAGADTTTAKE